ncbi:MAG: hypothetical protein Q8Q33_08120 [Chlamydiota bacterium]|nr:hypothetical protein [Chlamydiota bacterium]
MKHDTALNRVPHIIFSYWVIKIASTTLGETGADMFSMTFDLGYGITIMIFMSIFLGLLAFKLSIRKYTSLSYWLVFTSTAIVGTAISDFIDRTLELGYAAGSAILLAMLLVTLALWYLKERSLSVEHISTSRAEMFYWTAFLIANTLGTAAGDFLSDVIGIGFLESAVLISMVLLVTALAYYFTKISRVFLFWVAFVLTRPFGATFGDLLTKPVDHGGLNLGAIAASGFFAIMMIIALTREAKMESNKALKESS